MAALPPAQSLRILCIDGGGIKGYTALLILKRIFRTIAAEGQLATSPRPCDIFHLITGTSTGGLIAVMLGRLHMTVDECITVYEQLGKEVFGKRLVGGQLGRIIKGMASSPFYDVNILQEQIRKVLESKNVRSDELFIEPKLPHCKVMLCVTRVATGKSDVLRNYESIHPTAENYQCRIWEATSATAAAPMYFKGVKFSTTGEKWYDGGLRRNNPINEALAEVSREKDWNDKQIGCLLSLGTGATRSNAISSSLASFLKGSVKIMTDAEDTAKVFAASVVGMDLARTHRYFRFNVPQGMEDLQLDEWRETDQMRALTTEYLSHVGSGDLVKQCARSLLYPDENLQIVFKPKRSILPYHPCTHFVKRPLYAERLRTFFSPHMEYRQIFALWGLGGVGKTQIALEFAQSMRLRLSVFWIRADNLTNFIVDYSQVLGLLDSKEQGHRNSSVGTMVFLEETRKRLEELSGDWLLILDNADHLGTFLGTAESETDGPSISKYIPRRGRILITTRDRRFQGSVAAASDGLCVNVMTESEAEDLLLKSVPGHLVKQSLTNKLMAKNLVEELGYLPLAIAQAAANIVDQQLSFAEYVRLYQEKKHRMCLMRTAAHDFANTDPRNSIQSVAVTWQISIDILEKQSPQSMVFLRYLGYFHWHNVPQIILQALPQFQGLDMAQFIQLTKRPLGLSLIEEYQDDETGFVMYSIHPLLHEIMTSEVSSEEKRQYLEPAVAMMSKMFPMVPSTQSEKWPFAVFLAPHAARQVELCQDVKFVSEPLAGIMYSLSHFYGLSSMFNAGANLSVASVQVALELFGPDENSIFYLRKNEIDRLNEAARYEQAEQEISLAAKSLESTNLVSLLGESGVEREHVQLMSALAVCLRGLHRFSELEDIHRRQLQSQYVDPWSVQGIVLRHNLAHTLLKKGRPVEAAAINHELLEFYETENGKALIGCRLHLIMLNLKALIMRSHLLFRQYEEELLLLYRRVFRESMENLGIQDVDTWKAANNFLSTMSQSVRIADMGAVLWDIIPAAIAAKVKAEGILLIPIAEVHFNITEYLEHFSKVRDANSDTIKQFKELVETWCYVSGMDFATIPIDLQINKLNSRGVHRQHRGQYEEAEKLHRKAIELSLVHECGDDLRRILYYNRMLAMGSSGRREEALAFRKQHLNYIESEEMVHGRFESRMNQRENDSRVYHEAKDMLEAGRLRKQDQWWLERSDALRRAENRFGVLDEPKLQAEFIDTADTPDKGRLNANLQ